MKEKREQLQRCYEWLKQEPNDFEVIEKVKELEKEINDYESEQDKKRFNKERQKKYDEIKTLEKEIRSNKRDLNSKVFTDNEDLRILKLALDDVTMTILKHDIKKYNELVAEFKEKYM